MVGGLKIISGENEYSSGCEDMQKDTGVGKLILVPMNSKSHETSA